MDKLIFDEAFDLTGKEIQGAFTKSPQIIRDYLTHLSASKGKMIRATSVLICAEDKEGKINSGAVQMAAAIEVLHLASLVHDDVIDDADLRRGQETLQKKFGKRTAVICGDYLLSIALKMAANIPDRKNYMDIKLPDYISRLCLGELRQHVNYRNVDLTVFEYIKIISGKTAALFEASFLAGAYLGDCPPTEVKRYKKIGNYVGLIFQLQDDCMDFDKTVEQAGKPVQSDYEQGVVTLPLLYALHGIKGFKQRAFKENISREDINRAVEQAEGLEYTRGLIQRYYDKAENQITHLDITDEKRKKIMDLLTKATGRQGSLGKGQENQIG